MPEYHKSFDLSGARLLRTDIEKLGHLISDGISTGRLICEFELTDGDARYKAKSIDELLSQDLPESVDDLSFSASSSTDDHYIDRRVSLYLSRTGARCHVGSHDHVWFKGKIQQLTEFFAQRALWYQKVYGKLGQIFGFLQALSIFAMFFFLWSRFFLFALFAMLTFILLFLGFSVYLKGNLFPAFEIRLTDNSRRLTRETLAVIFAGVGAIGTIAGVVVQIIQKS